MDILLGSTIFPARKTEEIVYSAFLKAVASKIVDIFPHHLFVLNAKLDMI